MKKKILSLCSFLLVMFFAIGTVSALEVAKAGETIVEEGTYDSLRFVAGNKVTNNATVDGISFIAGNDLYLEGNVTYGMYAGNMLTISGAVDKDLLAAGNKIVITDSAIIGRDVYLAANQIDIKANLPRDLRAGGNTIDLSGITINGDAYLATDTIIMNEDTVIAGTLTYYSDAKVTGLESANIANVVTKTIDRKVIEYGFKERLYEFVVSLIAAIITMICLLYFVPKTKDGLNKLDLSFGNIAKTTCIGFAILIIIPIVALIAMFTGFLTPLAVITFAIYFIAVYLSNLMVAYVVGNAISKHLLKKEDMYMSIAIGILLVRLAGIIPFVSGYISALVLFYGLGIIYELLKSIRNK